jgi:hypothetical protein
MHSTSPSIPQCSLPRMAWGDGSVGETKVASKEELLPPTPSRDALMPSRADAPMPSCPHVLISSYPRTNDIPLALGVPDAPASRPPFQFQYSSEKMGSAAQENACRQRHDHIISICPPILPRPSRAPSAFWTRRLQIPQPGEKGRPERHPERRHTCRNGVGQKGAWGTFRE